MNFLCHTPNDPVCTASGLVCLNIDSNCNGTCGGPAPWYQSHSWLFDKRNDAWLQASGYTAMSINNEAGSLLLPDGTVLFGNFDRGTSPIQSFQRYIPSYYPYLGESWIPCAHPPVPLVQSGVGCGGVGTAQYSEIGPFLLLHDGRVLVLGGDIHNALFTPPTSVLDPGSWTAAADTLPDSGRPGGPPPPSVPLNFSDAVGVVEPNGKVLAAATMTVNRVPVQPGTFEEYDPTLNQWAYVLSPAGSNFAGSSRIRMLALPNGWIIVTGDTNGVLWFYKPEAGGNPAWRPTISAVYKVFGRYILEGTQLNGLTTGADFGDDAKLATNYPIVSLSNAGGTSYMRTYDVDQMAPRPGKSGSCKFDVPPAMFGSFNVAVTANGVSSTSSVSVTVPAKDVGPAVVQMTLFRH